MLDTLRFKSNFPKDSELRLLSNLADREFEVSLPLVSRRPVTFGSVEALYQGLKFTHTEEFACGGLLDGERGVKTVEVFRSSYWKVRASLETGFSGMLALRLANDAVPNKLGRDGLLEKLGRIEGLEGLGQRRKLPQNDSALLLLACQSLMYSQNESARRLLLSTGAARLVEHDETGNFWSQTPDGSSGQNANGQNLMLIRRLLLRGGAGGAGRLSADLFRELDGLIHGGAEGSRWNELDPTGNERLNYTDVLEKVELETEDSSCWVLP